jgi:cell division protein FtsI (penicillin-binding protein 3)
MHLVRHLQIWNNTISQKSVLVIARKRIFKTIFFIALGFLIILARLAILMIFSRSDFKKTLIPEQIIRGNILDRNGEILATQLYTTSLYANPQQILDRLDAFNKLKTLFPNDPTLLNRLSNKKKTFVWIARHISPPVLQKFYNLGIPGIYAKKDTRRFYPKNNLFSHVVGYCGIDGDGLAGIEKSFDAKLAKNKIKLSLDARVQYAVRDELSEAIKLYRAKGANAIVMHKSGQVIACVSLPDFNPNYANEKWTSQEMFNRNTLGSYEPGSTFKIVNVAISLSEGKSKFETLYDARQPVRIGRFTVKDFRGKYRFLTLKEAFVYSSNIAAIKIAQQFGKKIQQTYFKRFKLFDPLKIEIPEVGKSKMPKIWSDVTLMSASYGYGVSVTPLHLLATVHGLVNHGKWVQPTFFIKKKKERQILSPKISQKIRALMRATVLEGGSKKANVEGYDVFGKTGTAYINMGGRYLAEKARMNSFIGGFPKDNPEYMLVVMLEDPQAIEGTFGFAAAGWNVAPTAGRIIGRIVNILNLEPA